MPHRWVPALILATLPAVLGCRSACGGSEERPRARPESALAKDGKPPSAALDARERNDKAVALMLRFAERTGLVSNQPNRRYLWTDAFAVCNLLGLARATGDERHTELGLRLVSSVHHTLGKHRPDDLRKGWLSGLDPEQAEAHPTRGGLRIGKDHPERRADEAFDEELEWERDGQYFHYLTKWMHALDQAARATGKPVYNDWARELAETAHRAFTHPLRYGERRRIYWKMSIDLSRPLVSSMGQHDALDGYITAVELRATASALPGAAASPKLDDVVTDYAAMIDRGGLATSDPLGIGGLLTDAWRLQQLGTDAALRDALLAASRAGLERYAEQAELELPAGRRLAFRELGLAIGLRAVVALRRAAPPSRELEALRPYEPLSDQIIAFWLDSEHQRASSWLEHRDIDEVMLATALAPEGFLSLGNIGH